LWLLLCGCKIVEITQTIKKLTNVGKRLYTQHLNWRKIIKLLIIDKNEYVLLPR